MATVCTDGMAIRLCRLFGLDPGTVTQIDIKFEPGNVVYAIIHRKVKNEETEEVLRYLEGRVIEHPAPGVI